MKKNIHVVPHSDGWAVKKAGSARASKVTSTQKGAIEFIGDEEQGGNKD